MKQKIPTWIKNKYLLVLAVFGIWLVFFDKNDLITQWGRKNSFNDIEKSKAYYQKEIQKTRAELKQLDSNPALLEKYAREKYYMKKKQEEIYVMPDLADSPQN
jgi:cell division protein DivIC